MTVNKVRLWAPKATALSYPTSHSLSLSLSLSSSSLSVLLQRKKLILTDHSHAQRSFCFLPIQCSFCSFFFVLLPSVTHTLTHTHPSQEIIGVDLQSHTEKLHHAFVLLIAAIAIILQFGRSVKISIHSSDLLDIHSNDLTEASNRHPQQRSGRSVKIGIHSNNSI